MKMHHKKEKIIIKIIEKANERRKGRRMLCPSAEGTAAYR